MRIVGGALRSRALRAPKGDATRPTSDKVRQALFDVLGDLSGLRVLDLWSGSGALALEAISRGAASAVCVESAKAAATTIAENVASLGVGDRVRVIARRVEDCAQQLHRPPNEFRFDLVLADPPWAEVGSGAACKALASVIAANVLAPDALVVLEHGARDEAPDVAGLDREDTRRWGDTAVTFYRVRTLEPMP